MNELFEALQPTSNKYTELQAGIVEGSHRVTNSHHVKPLLQIIEQEKDKKPQAKLKSLCEQFDFTLLLRYAAAHNCLQVARYLLENISPLNINSRGTTSGKTALFLASEKGHLAMVKLLAKHGAFLNAFSSEGKCPASIALDNQHWLVAIHLASVVLYC